MSTQPTGLSASSVIAMDIPGTVALISQYNANAIAVYHQTVSNWLTERGQTTTLPPPTPITIQQVDQNALLNWYNAVQNYFASGATTTWPLLTAISSVPYPADPRIAAALTAATGPAQPSDPVGAQNPDGTYAEVPGDTNPLGFIATDSRGKFVKVGTNTPFGIMGAAYIKIS